MRAKLLLVAALGSLAFLTSSQAGWHGGGCYGGGWHGGGGYYGGGGGGGGWGWGGWGWGGPAIGISLAPAPVYYAAPAPVYRTVYYAQPAAGTYYGSDPVLAAAQNRLGKLGYYRGYVDGQFGPRTNQALLQYQSDYGLPITGRLDHRTRASLGV